MSRIRLALGLRHIGCYIEWVPPQLPGAGLAAETHYGAKVGKNIDSSGHMCGNASVCALLRKYTNGERPLILFGTRYIWFAHS